MSLQLSDTSTASRFPAYNRRIPDHNYLVRGDVHLRQSLYPRMPDWILLRDADVLGLGEETQRFFATFAAYPALLHAAERNSEVSHEPAVYPHRAGVDTLGD